MELEPQEFSELVLPESKEKKGYLVYLKIVFIPTLLYTFVMLGYLKQISFQVGIHTLVVTGIVYLSALIFTRHSTRYAYNIFERQKDEFKQALKRYIMKHFLTIGKDTKSDADFDDFANAYIKGTRNENFAAVGATIFPMMGILGTFISIALSVPNFSSSNTEALEQEITLLLSGVGAAFYMSIYGIFLALWWIFFEKIGSSRIQRLLDRQKNSTKGFFWTKEELNLKHLNESLQHFDKIGTIFKQVDSGDFFSELDRTIERKFGIFQDMLNIEEKTIRLSSEHIKQSMSELSKMQRDQRDLGKLYSEMLNGVSLLNQNLREVSTRMSKQYNRLLNISTEKITHLDKTLESFDDKIEHFSKNFKLYEKAMLESQEKIFNGFKTSLFEGMEKFKEIYEGEKNIDEKIELMDEFKKGLNALDNETKEVIAELEGKENEDLKATQGRENKENLKKDDEK